MEGVIQDNPLPTCVPPAGALNQVTGSADVALRLTVPVPQRWEEVVNGIAGTALIVAVTAALELGQARPACA